MLIYVCNFHHHHPLRVSQNTQLSRYSCLHLGSPHPRFSFSKFKQKICCFCFRFVSITLVFLNKTLLSGAESVDAPLFITCFQCAVTAAVCYGIATLPPNFGEENMNCTQISISVTTLKRVLPLSLVFVAMITFNNLCLKFVGVSFYYIGMYLVDFTKKGSWN